MPIRSPRQFFTNIYRNFFQSVVFDNDDRREFLEILQVQLSFNLSMGQIFKNIQVTGSTPQIKKLAMQSARNLTAFNDCTRNWQDYFSVRDVLLLRTAVQQDNLARGIDLVLSNRSETVSFADVVIKRNSQYILFVLGFLIMYLVLQTQRSMLESFNKDMLLFDYIDWFYNWGPIVIMAAAFLYLIYWFYRSRLLGKPRLLAYKLGIYLIYDRIVAYQFCLLASDSLRSGLDITEVMRFSADIYTEKRQRYGLFAMRQRLTDGFPLASALNNTLFEPRYSDYLATFAPSEGREQLAQAFEKVAFLLNKSVERHLHQLGIYLTAVLLLLGFLLFYPLLQLMTGTAISPSM
jgi:type II secretory pathway component PulF